MRNKIWIALVVVLIIALVGVYMASVGPKKLGASLTELAQRLDAEIQKLNNRVPPYVYTGPEVGYVVEFENGVKFYITGDTTAISDMKYIIGDYYKPDVAFLSMGDYTDMSPELAAYAANLINPKEYVVPTHYASFPMLSQLKDVPRFVDELKNYNLKVKTLVFEPGEEKEILGVKALWLGHGAWLWTSPEGTKILIDPEMEYNPAFPEKYKDISKFGKIDLILLTHGHFDHATIPDLKKWVKVGEPVVIAPWELGIWLKGYLDTVVFPANKGSALTKERLIKAFGLPLEHISDITIYMTTASHSSSGTPYREAPAW